MNALDVELLTELAPVLEELATDTSVRCVVLTGSGEKAFSAGGDITAMGGEGLFAGGTPGRK
jgi:enoyl-CoA hydratase/carnithine racemase